MNIDDINHRMERVYLSINQRFDKSIKKYIKTICIINGKRGSTLTTFDGGSRAEKENQIVEIISSLSKLKDHLKNIYRYKKGDVQMIENEISSSEYLKIIIDLDNREKHGKLDRGSRSGKFPYLDNVESSLLMRGSMTPSGECSIIVDPINGEFKTEGNVVISIGADIKDQSGNKICSLDDLVNKSIEKWEEIIKKFNLI